MVNENLQEAKAFGRALSVSKKHSVEVARFIRNKNLREALNMLEKVIEKKQAIQFKKFMKGGVGHKKKLGPGRYPVNACKVFVKLLQNVEANAQSKGLDISGLFIKKIVANKAPKAQHFGRKRGRVMKRAHIEVVVAEKSAGVKMSEFSTKGKF